MDTAKSPNGNSNEKPEGQEWIKAAVVAERLEGISKLMVGRHGKAGSFTRRDEKGIFFYPWPKVKGEYAKLLETKQNYSEKVTNAAIRIDTKETSNIITTEKLIVLMEKGTQGSEQKAYQWARAMKEMITVKKEQIKLRELEGITLDVNDVERWVSNVSRANKEFWMNWPQHASTEMANELGVDSRQLYELLMKQVRKNLERIATLPDGYGAAVVEEPFEGPAPTT